MTEALKAAILGAVQGITEFLPISSSAHLLALEKILDFHAEGVAFDVSLHLATLLAIVLYFRQDILHVLAKGRRWAMGLRIGIATVPVVILGFLLRDLRENPSPWLAVGGWAFSGAYLLATRRWVLGVKAYTDTTCTEALGIGLAQSLSALVPGVSRSGVTVSMGLWLGLAREHAARFSFLIAIPAMFGAGLHEALKLLKSPESQAGIWVSCGVGMPVAFIVGWISVDLLLRTLRGLSFHRFGFYNWSVAGAFALYLALHG